MRLPPLSRCLLALVLLLGACSPPATTEPSPSVPAATLTPTSPPILPTLTPLPTPEGAAAAYLAAWQQGDYAGMYALLTSESQAAYPLEAFQQQYQTAQTALSASGVAATLTGVGTDPATGQTQAQAHLQYSTRYLGSLETDVVLPLQAVGDAWRVVFNPAVIWPDLVDGQQLYLAPLPAARGALYDRNGAPLVTEAEAYAVGVVPGQIVDVDAVAAGVGRLLGVPAETARALYEFAPADQYLPLAEVSAAQMQDRRYSFLLGLDGLSFTPYSTSRFYHLGGAAAHVTGYTIFIPPDELEAYRDQGYFSDQRLGSAGLEKWAEAALRGKNSAQLVLLDAAGSPLRPLTPYLPPTSGEDITTTLDAELQRAAQAALGDFPGAVVVLKRDTGEVLALASSPSFDPNLLDPANVNTRFTDGGRLSAGFLNRAAQDAYPAGSVFKVVTLSAGLASGLFTPDSEYVCTGQWSELGPTAVLNDWKEGGHGRLTLLQGLAGSCNPYFWHIGLALFNYDPAYLSRIARAFGLGQPTGIGQIEEIGGLIPDPDWKQRNQGQAWEVLDSLNVAIGQGDVLVTPLQIARLMAAIGNGGTLYQPQLVLRQGPPDGSPTLEFQPVAAGALPLTPEQLSAVQSAMYQVTQDPLGTARARLRNLPRWLKVAGKTGTAENPGTFGLDAPDAWFAGYTFAGREDRPDIAIAVVVNKQGQGSDFAAPIFRRMLESYFGLNLTRYPWESAVGVVATPTPLPEEVTPEAETPTPQP